MKTPTCVLLVAAMQVLAVSNIQSQNLFAEAKSGYGANYLGNRQNYSSPVDYVPLQFSVGGGLKNLQAGLDFRFNLSNPSYIYFDDFTEAKRVREETKDSYFGGFLRLNTSEKPQENAGFILKAGLGRLQSEKVVYNLPEDNKHESLEFEPTIQYVGEAGVNIPVVDKVHIYLGVGLRYASMKRKENNVTVENYDRTQFIGNLGVSGSLDL